MIFAFFLILNSSILFFFDKIADLLNFYDMPDYKRKIHTIKVPSIGGIIIFFNFSLLSFLYFFNLINIDLSFIKLNLNNFFILYLFGSLIFFLGLLDDKYNLNSNLKLLILLLICSLFIYFDRSVLITSIDFSFIDRKINLGNFSYFFSILCFLLFINAFNMFDGINLQSISYAIFIMFIFCLDLGFGKFISPLLISFFTFFFLNYNSKCFLGNNGSNFIAFLIAVFITKIYNLKILTITSDHIFLIMMIPGIELLRLAILRIYNKKNPFSADKNHLHHLLLNKFGYWIAFLAIQTLIVLPNILAFFLPNLIIFLLILTLIVYFFLLIICSKKNRIL